MMGKIWIKILIVIIAFTALGGKKPVKVRIWDNRIHDKPYRLKMFKKFNQEHEDVQIEHTSLAGGMMVQMLNLAFKTGRPPEVFAPLGELTLVKLEDLGWIVSLDDIAPDQATFEAWKARFPADATPFVEGLNMFDGKIYSFPWEPTIYGNVLYY
ncbi:MAG: extracellular solute-binding protein, partial [Proteobacteria bacterium]|nr:extracellular solute-binding protein [Pseudomonadota bacterium]